MLLHTLPAFTYILPAFPYSIYDMQLLCNIFTIYVHWICSCIINYIFIYVYDICAYTYLYVSTCITSRFICVLYAFTCNIFAVHMHAWYLHSHVSHTHLHILISSYMYYISLTCFTYVATFIKYAVKYNIICSIHFAYPLYMCNVPIYICYIYIYIYYICLKHTHGKNLKYPMVTH